MAHSKVHLPKCSIIVLLVLTCSLGASGQVLRGNVVNGTTRKPAAGDDVVLIKIDKVMNEEKRTKTNAHGEFSFDLPDSQSMRNLRSASICRREPQSKAARRQDRDECH